jgi:hypothetical protein
MVFVQGSNLNKGQFSKTTVAMRQKMLFLFLTSLYNIYSLTIILLNSCDKLFRFLLIYYIQLAFTICLQAG